MEWSNEFAESICKMGADWSLVCFHSFRFHWLLNSDWLTEINPEWINLMKFQNELLNFSKVFLFNVHLNCENTLNLINSGPRGQQQKTLRTLRRVASLLVWLSHDIIFWNSYVISICWLKTHQFPHNWWQRSKQSDKSKLL